MTTATLTLARSSVARKAVMGLTGLGLCGFVLSHMAGNLLLFKSAEAYNMYGHQLTHNPIYPLLAWGIVGMLVLHFLCAMSLTYENFQAREQRYAVSGGAQKSVSLASKTMAATGLMLLAFIILHLLDFKYGAHYTIVHSGVEVRDLQRLVVEKFHQPLYVIGYCVSLALLGCHLKHGFAACFQSLGFGHPLWTKRIRLLALIYAAVVALGFMSQPIYVYFYQG